MWEAYGESGIPGSWMGLCAGAGRSSGVRWRGSSRGWMCQWRGHRKEVQDLVYTGFGRWEEEGETERCEVWQNCG